MRELNLFFLLLILQCSTQLFAQVGKPNSDTIRCYGIKELQKIAATVEYANSCDTLLSNANLQIANKDKHIEEKIFQVKNLQDQIVYKDTLIVNREKKIGELNSEIIKLNEHKNMLKLAWLSTTALFSGIFLYITFR